ncbi:QacE family quaternary ammonium compound efflux SMR transporter [Planococcaceae bacterium Storch 2/2-2]|nr:QacE family quaternary ammonium compound efflux SMR transporter [Planococcaceae bacterium Storch 2/2-2]
MNGHVYLTLAIISEVIATLALKASDGFSVLLPSLVVVVGYGFAFYLLSKALEFLPLSIAYAIWSGVGTAATAVLGIVLFDDPFSVRLVFGIVAIIGGVVFLNLPERTAPEDIH